MNGAEQYQEDLVSSFYDANTNDSSKQLIGDDKISKSEENIDDKLAQFNRQQEQENFQNILNFWAQNQAQNQQKQGEYKYFLNEFIGNGSIDEMKEKLADPKVQEKAMEMLRDYQNGNINDPNLSQTISNLANNPQLQQEFQKQADQRKTEIETIKKGAKVGAVVGALGAAIVGCVFLGPWGLLLGIVGAVVGSVVGALVGVAINGIRRLVNKIKQLFTKAGNAIGNFLGNIFNAQGIRDKLFGKNTNTLDNAMAKMAQRTQTKDQMKYNNQKVGKSNKTKINKDKIKAKNKSEKNEKPNEKPIENKKEQVKEKIKKQSKTQDKKLSKDKNGNNKGYNNIKDQPAKSVDVNKIHKKPDINKLKDKQKDNAKKEKPKNKVEEKGITMETKMKGVEFEQKNVNKNKAENISPQTQKPAKSAQQQKTTFKLDMNQNNKATGINAKGGQAKSTGMGAGK